MLENLIKKVKDAAFNQSAQSMPATEQPKLRLIPSPKAKTKIQAKPSKNRKIVLSCHEARVNRAVELKQQLDDLQAEFDALKAELAVIAKKALSESHRTGNMQKTVLLSGTHGKAKITSRDMFKDIDLEQCESLEALLGRHYENLFALKTKHKFIGDFDAFVAEASELGLNVHKYFQMWEIGVPVPGFTERREQLRIKLQPGQNAELDQVMEHIRYAPSVSIV